MNSDFNHALIAISMGAALGPVDEDRKNEYIRREWEPEEKQREFLIKLAMEFRFMKEHREWFADRLIGREEAVMERAGQLAMSMFMGHEVPGHIRVHDGRITVVQKHDFFPNQLSPTNILTAAAFLDWR